MFNFQVLLYFSILLFLNFQPSETKPEFRRLIPARFSTRSLDCPAIESILSIGICSEDVFQLSKYTDQSFLTTVSLEYARNVTMMCNYMDSCFQESKCKDVKNAGKIYKDRCDRLEAHYYDYEYCLANFYEEIAKNTSCTKDYNYFSKDMEVKRAAWTSGKDCAQTYFKSNCAEKPRAYFNDHYDKLVELLTVDSDTEFYCGSFHDELIAMLCERKAYKFELAHEEWVIAQREGYAYTRNDSEITSMYRDVFNCMNEFCFFSDQQIRKLNKEYEEMMRTINWRDESATAIPRNQTKFEKCLVHIVQNVNILKYACVKEIPKSEEWTRGAGIINAPKLKLLSFLTDTECLKSVMEKECGWFTFETFDEDYEKLRNYATSIKMKLYQW
ncbi:unnamed protein product [Caenorhabditis nigoni]